jgi:AraC family transcriptional activator of pobA
MICDTVCSCNKLFDEKTLHPLVSVIDLSKQCKREQIRLDCYSMVLRHYPCKSSMFGRKSYDFSDGTLLFRNPEKSIDIQTGCEHEPSGMLLVFHPSLLSCSYLGQHIKDYTFFRYNPDEALHLSNTEVQTIKRCLKDIAAELEWGVDKYSATLICNKIEMLLNYCSRYYTRQFITRHDASTKVMDEVARKIDDYMLNGKIAVDGMPCACKLAQRMEMSSAYLNDMVRHETGKEFSDYVQLRRVELSKQMIVSTRKSDDEVASILGYCSTGCFRQLFEKLTGMTTNEYRN